MESLLGLQDLRQQPLQHSAPERGVFSCPLSASSWVGCSWAQGGQPAFESDGRVGTVRGRRCPRGRKPAACRLGAALPRTPESHFPSSPGLQDPLTPTRPPCSSPHVGARSPGPNSPSQELSSRAGLWDPFPGPDHVLPLFSLRPASPICLLFLFSEAIGRERLACACAFRGNRAEGALKDLP